LDEKENKKIEINEIKDNEKKKLMKLKIMKKRKESIKMGFGLLIRQI